ncbi:unnamed protein product [Rotaria magnacalcarata]|uniref:C2H2-type domain-containing protein n=1 Tax=Rotaria magnacalcarata TaxID=392030 RepID=A0A816M3E4_9BILA|nr:unnamed protein product [Rotaria magnacalcarata]
MSETYYFCPLCITANVFQTYSSLFKHIREYHRDDPSFGIRCELTVFCGFRYSTFDSYRRHIYRCHRSLIDSSDDSKNNISSGIDDIHFMEDFSSDASFNDESSIADNSDSSIYVDEEVDEMEYNFLNMNPITVPVKEDKLSLKEFAEFYTRVLLELREYHLLPQKIVQCISSFISTLLDMTFKLIKIKTSTSAFIPTNDLDIVFAQVISIINSISKNEYQFLKQCKNFFNYEAPTEIILNKNEERAYYIPLKQSIRTMLQNETLLKSITDNINSFSNYVAKDKDLILSNRQGCCIKSNMSRRENSNVLLLKLYTDGISVTNPIGAKRDFHKFTCFYYLLDDMPETMRSKVNSIGLFCMCYSKHLNDQNNAKILMDVLVNDLNNLQNEGITIACPSSRIYLVFSTVSADNLGANEVGGFQKTFSSGSFCRHCLITHEQRLIPLTDISFVPRTKLKHDMVLSQVIENNDDKIIQGVKCCSWFKNLVGFHPTESLPPDLMHDVAEGLCPLIITALLKEAIQQRILSYAQIEERTSSFNFGFNDLSNKPPPIKKQHLTNSNVIDRVKFVDQRTKLIESFKEHDPDTDEITDVTHHHDLPDSPVLLAAEENQNGQTRDDISSNIDCNENNDLHVESRLPTDYTGPILTTRIQYYIDQNNLSKFNPHTTLRGEILSLLFDDVTKTYNLLYPNHDEYMIMAKSIVEKLSTPSALACEATKEWHESIKQKFKRERRPLQMDNKLVKLKQTKYNHGKENGRPKRKSVVAQAQRRTNDIPFINLNDRQNENLSSLVNQMNIELLKDNPDNNILHNLWSQSFNIRRLHVRELTIDELLERFPGYRRADLLLAEVKETAGIDLNENIDTLLPKFFECLPDNNCYLSDVLPIRIIRILCKRFGDSLGNVFTYQEVLVPYPCIKILEDKFELYLDFHLVAETNSFSTAVALLLSLYHIFEIRFANHNRCCRLLYSILFEDAHHLNKSLKNLLNNWNYKIINRPLIKAQTVIMNMTECFTQPSTDNENISSSSNNFTQIDDTKIKQTQQTRRSSSCSALTTSKNSVQDCLNPICENDYDQSSDFSDENVFNHSSTTSIPMNDSQLKSSMALQNVTQSLINTQRFSEDRSVQEKHELYAFKTPLQATENELQPDPPNENTISNSNLKQKRKQSQSSYSSTTSQRQSSRLGAKRVRVL